MSELPLIVFQVANGVIWGLVVALLSVGLNLVYGLLGIVNVAQGAFYMLGAYGIWLTWTYTGSFLLGLVLGPVAVGLAAILLERSILRPVEHDHDLTIIMTVGISLIIEQTVHLVFGGELRAVGSPFEFSVPLFGLNYPGMRIVLAAVALLALGALWVFLHRTRYGLWIRAVRHNPSVAQAMGVTGATDLRRDLWHRLGACRAGRRARGSDRAVRPEMGADIIIIVFVVVIVGGLGNIFGSAVIAVVLAATEGVATVFTSPTWARVISLAVMTCIILRWPQGLGGLRLRQS